MSNPLSVKQPLTTLPLLLLLAFLLGLSPGLNRLSFDDQRLIEFAIIGLSLLNIAIYPTGGVQLKLSRRHFGVLLCLSALMILSALYAEQPNSALMLTAWYLGLFFCCVSIAEIVSQSAEKWQKGILLVMLIAALLYLVNFFTGFLASFVEQIPLSWPEPFSGFSNVRFFNQYQIWFLLLLPLPFYPSLSKRFNLTIKIIATGWAVLLFASASRGAVLSLSSSLLLTWLIFRQQANIFLRLNIRLILFGAVVYGLLFKLIPQMLSNPVTQGWHPVESITDSSGRFELWAYAWQYIKQNPWLGIGPMHFAYYSGPTHAHPHNSVLQWASEIGIPSVLLLLYLVYNGLRAWVTTFYRLQAEKRLPVSPHLWIGLFASLCAGLIYSLFSGVIVMPLSQMMMVLIIGWMQGLYYRAEYQNHPLPPVTLKQRLGLQLLAGITLIILVYTALPDVLVRLNNEELPIQDYPVIAPRFWQLGGIPHH